MTTTGGAPETHVAPSPESRCTKLLTQHAIGRLGFHAPDGPVILRVSYRYWTDRLAFRTFPGQRGRR